MRSTLLLLANDPDILINVAHAAREAGFTVSPGRHHEVGMDALNRVDAQVALVHVGHDAADSVAFAALAEHRGLRVILFALRHGPLEERARVSLISARSRFPIVEYGDDATELLLAIGSAARCSCGA